MSDTLKLTILRAAYDLEGGMRRPFSAEALAVRTWELAPRAAGLKGYEQYFPDNNRVMSNLCGKKRGMICEGYFTQEAPKLYRLTNLGREVVKQAEKIRALQAQEAVS